MSSGLFRLIVLLAFIAKPALGSGATDNWTSFNFPNFSDTLSITPRGNEFFLDDRVLVSLSGRLIVKTTVSTSEADILSLAPSVNAARMLYSGKSFNYFLVTTSHSTPAKAIRFLNKADQILLVQPDILQLRTFSSAPAGSSFDSYLDHIGVRALWQESRGGGVSVAIIDDGIDLSHPALSDVKVRFQYDVQSQRLSAQPVDKLDTHGTRVASVIFAASGPGSLGGIASEAELIAIRQPGSWTSNTLMGFYLAALEGADVINCSWHTQLLLEPVADVVGDLTQHGRAGKGTLVVFAAGNEGRWIGPGDHEAALKDAMVVGAVDENGARLASSNAGRTVDLFAFGGQVKTLSAVGPKPGALSGTSLASSIVSGYAALLIGRDPDVTLSRLQSALGSAFRLSAPGGMNARDRRNKEAKHDF